MATVSMTQLVLEIEPYRIQSQIVASPAAFPVDAYTLAYVVPRYIVLHCIPLREEKFIALPANVKVLYVCASPDAEIFATLEQVHGVYETPKYDIAGYAALATNQSYQCYLGVYSIATQKRISTVLLDDTPHHIEFGRQNKSIVLFYRMKVIFLAWQRAQIDEVFEHKEGVCCVEKTSFYHAILSDSKHQIAFFRHQDGEFREYAPTRLFGRLRRQLAGCGFVSYHMSCLIGHGGEIFVFNAPKFLGFVPARREKRTAIYAFPEPDRAYLQLEGSVTSYAFKGRRVLLGTDCGEICLIELFDWISKKVSKSETEVGRLILTGELVDLEEVDSALDQLPRAAADAFGGSQFTVYPFTLLQQSVMPCAVRNLSMCYYYVLAEGVDGILYTWPVTYRCLVDCESTLCYKQNAQNALADERTNIYTISTLRGADYLSEREAERYNRIITAEYDKTAEATLAQRLADEKDVAAVSSDILVHYIIDQIDPYCATLRINTATAPALIADILAGVPYVNFAPYPLMQHATGPRSAIYRTHVLPAGFRLGPANYVSNIKLSRANPLADVAAVATYDNEIVLFTASTLEITARFNAGADIIDFYLHPNGMLLYAVYSEGIGMFVCYAGRIYLVQFATFNGIRRIEISHGGGFILAACDVGVPVSVKLLSDNLQYLRQLNCHNERIAHMYFLPGDAVVVSVSDDGACYGHLLGSFKRVFECLLRGVYLQSFFLVTQSYLQHGIIAEEIDLADDVSGGTYAHDVFCNKIEDFLLCGVDTNNRFHEIANGRQIHEITLPVAVTSHVLVLEPSGYWDLPFIARVAQANYQDELSAIEREGLPASSSVFNKNVAEAVEKGAKIQPLLAENYDMFYELGDAIGAARNETFVGRPVKFVLFGLANGEVACYEYPVRGADCIFRVSMCDSAVLGLHLIYGTILVVVCKNAIILSNLRFLLPASAIFGQNVRNRSLGRLKQLFDQSYGRKTLVRLPLVRMLPALSFSCYSRDNSVAGVFDRILFDVVIRSSETWRYNDFRQALLRQSARERASVLAKLAYEVRSRTSSELCAVEARIMSQQRELEAAETDFKTAHSSAYRTASERHGRVMAELRDERQRLERDAENSIARHRAALESARRLREEQLQEIQNSGQRMRATKQAEIDALDDTLGRAESVLQEELRQLTEERDEALQILRKASEQTLSRESGAASALRSYRALQERRLSQLKAQIALVRTEAAYNIDREQGLYQEIQQTEAERTKLLETLRQKDARLYQREDEIFALKRELYNLSYTHLVLSHQIQQFKSEIRPREELTADMRTRVTELGSRLEASKGKWATLSAVVKTAREYADTLQKTLHQHAAELRCARRAFTKLKNDLKGIIVDRGQEEYCKQALLLTLRWAQLGNALRTATPKENTAAAGEFATQREHLQKRLSTLYQELAIEELRYVTTQASGLDENSALLNEAHRLRDENIALRSQLQRVYAMIEAVRVKELAKTVAAVGSTIGATSNSKGSPNARSKSIGPAGEDFIRSRLASQTLRAQSQLSQLEAEKFTLRGIMGGGYSEYLQQSYAYDAEKMPDSTKQTPKQDAFDPRSPNVNTHRTPFDPKKYGQNPPVQTPAQ